MNYLGANRVVTNSYKDHVTAEDYAGAHLSPVKINGTGKVIKIINSFHSHEDSINYNDFLNHRKEWKRDSIYHCISITGKEVLMKSDELGGNQIWIETYDGSKRLTVLIAHLDSVLVNTGDIVDENTILGLQGNTGLVLSSKDTSNVTYGSHVHLEIADENGNYQNPRPYALGTIKTSYNTQSNSINGEWQIKIEVDRINIRQNASELSSKLGTVNYNEVYNILNKIDSDIYTWYEINTSNGIHGFVANKKDEKWVTELGSKKEEDIPKKEDSPQKEEETKKIQLIFECSKDDIYYLKLYKGEKLYIQK